MRRHELIDGLAKAPPLKIMRTAKGQHHVATLMEFIALGMATKAVGILKSTIF